MRRQPQMAYAWLIHQAALDHVPAHRALQRTEQKYTAELPRQRAAYRAAPQEIHEGHEEHDADQTSQQAMEILPPENSLEFRNTHIEVA